jgi:hypothetical protein
MMAARVVSADPVAINLSVTGLSGKDLVGKACSRRFAGAANGALIRDR